MSAANLDMARIAAAVEPTHIGSELNWLEQTTSTNSVAQSDEYVERHGCIIFAEWQDAGRGRLQRSWHAPRSSSILSSAVVVADQESTEARGIWLWSALAAHQTLEHMTQCSCEIKWPNDILCKQRKLCGILIESKPLNNGLRSYAIGIGINCSQQAADFPDDLRRQATSIQMETHSAVEREVVASTLIAALDDWYTRAGQHSLDELKCEWQKYALPIGSRITILSAGQRFSGSLIELDLEAGIVIQLDNGGRRLFDPFSTTIESA